MNSLRLPSFRLLWLNLLLTSLCWNVQNVLVSWLVLVTTGSSLLLGVTMAVNFAPQAFGLISGVVADRLDKRKLIMIVNAAQVSLSIIMGFLIIGREIQFWHITLIVFVGSTVNSFSMPAQQAYAIELVGKDNTANATSLNMVSIFISGICGPSLVGALVDIIGIGPLFYLNALCFGLAIAILTMIRKTTEAQSSERRPVLNDIREGLSYSWQNRTVLGGELVYLITNIYMWPCVMTLIPIFARSALNLDASGLGWLTASFQLGGFVANISLAFKEPKRKGLTLFAASLMWSLLWLLFTAFICPPISMTSLFIMGITSSLMMTLASIILLLNAKPEIRGRVMGIQTLAISSQSPGNLIAGALTQSFGVVTAINAEAVLFILTMLGLMKLVPEFRKAE